MSSLIRRPSLPIVMTAITAVPILGTFFPLESYLSLATPANPSGVAVAPTIVTSLVLMSMYALIICLIISNSRDMLDALARNWFLLVLAAWAIVTALWAESPSLSFNRSGRLLLAILYGIYIARMFDQRTMLRILFFAVLIGICASTLVTLVAPNLSRVYDARGAYRGAFPHKNVLGGVASMALFISFFCFRSRVVSGRICILLILMSGAFLILANSTTAMLDAFMAGSLGLYLWLFGGSGGSQDRILALLVGLALAGTAYVLLSMFPNALDFLGRDFSSLTGRTDVWRLAGLLIDMKPVWGWGHGAWFSPVFTQYGLSEIGWSPPHAHNTWLDIRLQLGIPGFVIAMLCAAITIKRALAAAMVCLDSEYLLWITILFFQITRSFVETMFIEPGTNEMLFMTLSIARLGMLTAAAGKPVKSPARSYQSLAEPRKGITRARET